MTMITARAIREILARPEGRDWTIQGLGMLRLYLDEERAQRLHVWDPDLAFKGVSTIHDHPWDFESLIISGSMDNVRYYQDDVEGRTYEGQRLVCGSGAHLIPGTKVEALLRGIYDQPWHRPGENYKQEAPELHDSLPQRGTVTVITRTFHADRDVVRVFWRPGEQWGSAEPRPATPDEVRHFCGLALGRWDG